MFVLALILEKPICVTLLLQKLYVLYIVPKRSSGESPL